MEATPRASRASTIGHLAAVLLLPLLVLWRQDNPLFTGYGYLDPWYYFGFFRNLAEFKRNLFPGTYYGSRLSVILPGALAYSLFPPVAANCILHLTIFSVSTVSLFFTLKWATGPRPAFLATLVFAMDPWFWSAAGWDNPDGFAIAYCLLTMALLTWAALAPPRRWALLAAGASLGALVYANLFWVSLAPLLPLGYIGLTWIRHRLPVRRSLVDLCVWLGAGGVLITVALGIVNYFLDGHFFFYAPSVLEALTLHGNGPKWDSPWQGYAPAPWLWIAAVAAVVSISALAGRKPQLSVSALFAGQFLLALAWMAYVQAHGNAVLGIYFYACFLLPLAFLAIGGWLWPALAKLSAPFYIVTATAGALLFALAWLLSPRTALPSYLPAAGAALLLLAILFRRFAAAPLLSLVAFALLAAPGIAQRYGGLDSRQLQRQFESLLQARGRIETVRAGHAVRFWYDDRDPAAPDATALRSSYLWASSLLADNFVAPCDAEVVPSTIVAVISADPDPESNFARMPLATRTLDGCWAAMGMRAAPVETDTIHREAYDYTLSLLRVEPIPDAWQPIDSGRLPLDRWAIAPAADSLARLERRSDGIKLTTHAEPDSVAALYPPLTAPETALYRVRLRMWPGDGIVGFHARDAADARSLLGSTSAHYWNGSDSDMVLWIRLAAGQQFQLTLTNANGAVHKPATILLHSLAVDRVALTSAESPKTAGR